MINAARSASSNTINARRTARCTGSTIANRQSKIENEKWARQDSNLGPRDYESPALTAELQALFTYEKERSNISLNQLTLMMGLEAEKITSLRHSPGTGTRAPLHIFPLPI